MSSGDAEVDAFIKDTKIPIPSTVMFLGTTMTGKSTLHYKLYKFNDFIFDPPPVKMVYCYGEVSDMVEMIEELGHETHYGLPSFDYMNALPKPAYVGIDDLIDEASEEYLTRLFTRKVHHSNMSVGLISQDVFNKKIRVSRNNTQITFLTQAPNNMRQIRDFGVQNFPGEVPFFMAAYNDATKDQYGYIMVNNHPRTRKRLRLQKNVFPDEGEIPELQEFPDVYVPKRPKLN